MIIDRDFLHLLGTSVLVSPWSGQVLKPVDEEVQFCSPHNDIAALLDAEFDCLVVYLVQTTHANAKRRAVPSHTRNGAYVPPFTSSFACI